jgi:multidrug resistance protein, MATE family
MQQTMTQREKIIQLLHIFLPVFITQVGQYAMNFADVTMSGHASSSDLAGVAIGSSLWVPIFTGMSGILLALTPIVAQHFGAKRYEQIPHVVIQTMYLAIVISLAIIAGGAAALNPILNHMNLEAEVQQVAYDYLIALSFGMIPLFLYYVLRCFIDALGQTKITMFITLTALPINILFNYLLIYGKFGFPKLGGVGSGYATTITYWYSFFIAVIIVRRFQRFDRFNLFERFYRISFTTWKKLLKIGLPIGFAIFFETSIFAAVTLLMSEFHTTTIAAHQSAMNFASFLYMIPLSISTALTIAVGFEVGANRYQDAKQYSFIGIGMAVSTAVVTSLLLYFFRGDIAKIYTNEQDVLFLTEQFLLYAIFFQFSDAVAAPIQGALRGYKDVNATFWAAFVSYWCIGLPFGYTLANFTSFGAFGYWIGLIAGLASGAIFLFFRLLYVQRRYKHVHHNENG